jgi:hypothetical protein
MNESRRRRKLTLSGISFVNMLEMLHLPPLWDTEIVPSATQSCVEFSYFPLSSCCGTI